MRKALLISYRFPPQGGGGVQRSLKFTKYLREYGWEPVVLAVDPEFVEGGVRDPLLESTFPKDVRVVRVQGIPQRLTRRFGFGGVWWRCGRALRRGGGGPVGGGGGSGCRGRRRSRAPP